LLFISDMAAELNAAAAAGFQVCGSQRPGNPEQLLGPWPVLESFEALAPFDIAA
jgi:methionine salvage enolase-phosphatase E1